MKMYRNYQKVCYMIEIPHDEMMKLCRKAYEDAEGRHFDFVLSKLLADKLVPEINKDLAEYGALSRIKG